MKRRDTSLRTAVETTFWWQIRAMLAIAIVTGLGCGGRGERIDSSGDPEADRRAEMRVGSDSGGGGSEKGSATLYERLGGEKGITAIVDDVTERTIADPRVNFERKDVRGGFLGGKNRAWEPTPANVARFKRHFGEFLTLAAGGPSQYSGREMKSVHEGMKITNAEFDAMVGDVKASMERLGYARRETRDLLAVIETTRKQVVEKP